MGSKVWVRQQVHGTYSWKNRWQEYATTLLSSVKGVRINNTFAPYGGSAIRLSAVHALLSPGTETLLRLAPFDIDSFGCALSPLKNEVTQPRRKTVRFVKLENARRKKRLAVRDASGHQVESSKADDTREG